MFLNINKELQILILILWSKPISSKHIWAHEFGLIGGSVVLLLTVIVLEKPRRPHIGLITSHQRMFHLCKVFKVSKLYITWETSEQAKMYIIDEKYKNNERKTLNVIVL